MKLVECVPNFSEGRDKGKIDAIAEAIRTVQGAQLLDVDPGEATNRTVFTIVGEPQIVVEAAFRAIETAAKVIDMSNHKGAHPRMGATDVCPFVPVANMEMEECVELAKQLGKRVGDELDIPVYLYEHAASKEEWQTLQNIRVGEYEALPEKLSKPEWRPDFGPAAFNAKAGATAIGARDFLIAYNININSRNKKLAKEIALEIRDTGRFKRDENGKRIRGEDGSFLRKPGRLDKCKATGWVIEEYNTAQVTMNLTNYHITPIEKAFDATCEEARKLGLRVTGSEIVGLVPKDALIKAGKHYLKKQGASLGVSEKTIIHTAIQSLGLNEVAPFDPETKIIEYCLPKGWLTEMTLNEFNDVLASDSPAPGGGSVAALAGSISAGLSSMVAGLTYIKKGMEEKKPAMSELGEKSQDLKDILMRKVDQDTEAFNNVMAAIRMPKKTDEEIATRAEAMLQANREAAEVPLSVLEDCVQALEHAQQVIVDGNPASLSDSGVAALMANAGAYGAYFNVLINIQEMEDDSWKQEIQGKAKQHIEKANTLATELISQVESRLQQKPE